MRFFAVCLLHRSGTVQKELNVHLPLIIRFPDGAFAGFRSQTLLQPKDVWQLLNTETLPDEPDAMHSSIRIGNEMIGNEVIGNNVFVCPDWFVYQKTTGDELYVKPDDRWEANDVADRCGHVLEQFNISILPRKPYV